MSSLAEVRLTGPAVIEASHQPWLELTCSCVHSLDEMAELDIKWYHGPGDSPFLQWVPGSGGEPQTVNRHWWIFFQARHVSDNNF